MNKNERVIKAIKAALEESEGVDVTLPYEAVTAMIDHFEAVTRKFADLEALEKRLSDLVLTHKTYVQETGRDIEAAFKELENQVEKEKTAAIDKIRKASDERVAAERDEVADHTYKRVKEYINDYIDDRTYDVVSDRVDGEIDKIKEEWNWFRKDVMDEVNYKLDIGIIRKNCRDE